MESPLEQKYHFLKHSKRLVIKIGSMVLANSEGQLNLREIQNISGEISTLIKKYRKQVILISSGAIAAGMTLTGATKRPKQLPEVQSLASIGQSFLIESYRKVFNKKHIVIAQILVTREDFLNRKRAMNISNTLNTLLKKGVLPIINENDTVATEEITFGDNDQLCSHVAHCGHADAVIIFSKTPGFFMNGNEQQVIPLIPEITTGVLDMVLDQKSKTGAGGMTSKIKAIKELVNSGEPVFLLSGKSKGIFHELLEKKKDHGTLFLPRSPQKWSNKKRWMAFTGKVMGEIHIDKGACDALTQKNSSLLAIGIREIQGQFNRGDLVQVLFKNQEIARGLCNYAAHELNMIKGQNTQTIKTHELLPFFEEVIHKNNLAVTASA